MTINEEIKVLNEKAKELNNKRMQALGAKEVAEANYKRALQEGVIFRPLGDVIYFNPPLIIKEEEIDEAVAVCKKVITETLNDYLSPSC